MATQTEENYLKALFFLDLADEEITISALSKELDVSLPSANSMVKKLSDKSLVEYQKYKPVNLTAEGRKEAALIIRNHRLTEMYLVEKMGFGWEEVHEIAEQIEHIKSPELFDRMDQLLGYPKFDPHGSPIPDKEGRMVRHSYFPLSECSTGDVVEIAALKNTSDEFLKFLNEKGIQLGQVVAVLNIEAYDKSMTVTISSVNQMLTKKAADDLLVKTM